LICGMHRSGTSLVTKCFECFGYGLGETLMAPSSDNPKGFFEDLDIVNLNDNLLRDNGSYWDAPVFVGQGPLSWDATHLDVGVKLLTAKLAREPRLAIKDPRLCLLLPFWRAVAESLNIPLRLCLVFRDPLDVAASLQQRNDLPLSIGLGLTQAYWSQLLTDTDPDSFVVSYDKFLKHPDVTLGRIATWLERPSDAQTTRHFLDDFLDEDMQHHAHRLENLQETTATSPALAGASQALAQRSNDQSVAGRAWDIGAELEIGAFSELLAFQLSDRLAQLHATNQEAARLQQQNAQHGFDLEDLSSQKAEREAHIDLLIERQAEIHSELVVSQSVVEKGTLALEAEKSTSQQLADSLSTEVAEKAVLARQLERTESDLENTTNDLRSVSNDLENTQNDLVAMEGKANWLFALLKIDYGRLLQYDASFLGRIHRLSRRCYRLLTLQRGRGTAYDDALAAAATFFSDHNLTTPKPAPRKRQQVLAMVRYTLKHPVSSLRSMSLPRVRKIFKTVTSTEAQDLETWVAARFPEAEDISTVVEVAPAPDAPLIFPASKKPVVSIVIPVYNEWVITHRCLWSILQHTEGEYEVIVADDCSTDETVNIATYVQGVHVVRHAENQRFLRNCNIAAAQARGEFILLLNNDTAVTAGWLPPLLALFENESVGIVGPKLLFPNGKLQEAGGIIWNDASGWNYGRADEPSRPQYNYVRETDYVSGAALMIRQSLWQAVDGFDEAFVPAYYEDTDLCFTARQAGFKVLYQPASTVVHYEGMSNGTDLETGQKQYQVINQQRFYDKWLPVLTAENFANGEHVPCARGKTKGQRAVLVVDHYVPHYDKDAGSKSTWMYLKQMVAMGYRVAFMGANFFPHQPYTHQLQQLGVEVVVGEAVAQRLDAWLAENLPYFDHIFMHRPHVAEQFLPTLKKHACCPKISYVGHDLHFLRTQREFLLKGDPALEREAAAWRERERAVIEATDNTLYFSDTEVAEVEQLVPSAHVNSIPLFILEDLKVEHVITDVTSLIFVAGFNHPPNIDAAQWLVGEILPLVLAARPDVHLNIVGSNPSSEVLALANDKIEVHGYVTESRLQELYAQAQCAVVPLRFGAGVKGKVLEAIQMGVPMVTTQIGAEGIPSADHVMAIADEPEMFAQAVIQQLDQTAENSSTREGWIAAHFSPAAASLALESIMGPAAKALDTTRDSA
ncbi:MAG: glycosyltransferase, partial [Halieaceae bacterium]|nr:glycosyltransferase [Halieaceae bacterium]